MGSLFGSKNKQSTTSTTNPFNGKYDDWAKQAGEYIMGNLGKTGTAYTGQLTPTTNSNLTNAYALANQYNNNQTLNDIASGKYLDPTTNPYAQAGYDSGSKSLMKQFATVDDTIKGSFNQNGLFNSSMRQNTQNKNAVSTKDALSDYSSKYWGDQYDKAVTNMLSANSTQANNLGNALTAGQNQQTNEQTALTSKYNEWLRQQGVSDQNISNVLNYLNTVKNPSQTTNTTTKSGGLFGK